MAFIVTYNTTDDPERRIVWPDAGETREDAELILKRVKTLVGDRLVDHEINLVEIKHFD